MSEAMDSYFGSAWHIKEDDGLEIDSYREAMLESSDADYDSGTLAQSKNRQRAKILREEYDAWLLEWTGQLTFSVFILDRIAELEN